MYNFTECGRNSIFWFRQKRCLFVNQLERALRILNFFQKFCRNLMAEGQFFFTYLKPEDNSLLLQEILTVGTSRWYINVCSGTLFGQPCENRRCESTVNFTKLTGPGSISAKTVPASPAKFSCISPLIRDRGSWHSFSEMEPGPVNFLKFTVDSQRWFSQGCKKCAKTYIYTPTGTSQFFQWQILIKLKALL